MARQKRELRYLRIEPGFSAVLPPRAKVLAVEPEVGFNGHNGAGRLVLVDTAPPEDPGVKSAIILQAQQAAIEAAKSGTVISPEVHRLAGYDK